MKYQQPDWLQSTDVSFVHAKGRTCLKNAHAADNKPTSTQTLGFLGPKVSKPHTLHCQHHAALSRPKPMQTNAIQPRYSPANRCNPASIQSSQQMQSSLDIVMPTKRDMPCRGCQHCHMLKVPLYSVIRLPTITLNRVGNNPHHASPCTPASILFSQQNHLPCRAKQHFQMLAKNQTERGGQQPSLHPPCKVALIQSSHTNVKFPLSAFSTVIRSPFKVCRVPPPVVSVAHGDVFFCGMKTQGHPILAGQGSGRWPLVSVSALASTSTRQHIGHGIYSMHAVMRLQL